MGERVDCVVLDVGQGSGNFYEVYDAGDQLIHTALVDLGSEQESTTAGGPSVQYIVDQLNTMASAKLDVVMLSHSDSDHINLIADVLENFSPDGVGKPKLEITWVVYAGQRSKYRKKQSKAPNVITQLTTFVPAGVGNVISLSSNETQFDPDRTKWKDYPAGPLKLRVLIANAAQATVKLTSTSSAPKRKAPESYTLNTNSIITVANYTTPTVATGDATGITMAAANEVITTSDLTKDIFADTFMVTAPHHGAKATTFNIRGITDTGVDSDALAKQNLTTFVANLKAKTLSVSAERVKSYKHPSMEILEFFWPQVGRSIYSDPLLTTSQGHWTTAYFTRKQYPLAGSTEQWPKSEGWRTVQTTYDVFTNLYFVADRVGTIPGTGPALPPPAPPLTVPVAVPPSPIDTGEDVDTTGATAPPLGATWVFRTPAPGTGARSVERATNRTLLLVAERRARALLQQIRGWTAMQTAQLAAAALPPIAPAPRQAQAQVAGPRLRGLKVVR